MKCSRLAIALVTAVGVGCTDQPLPVDTEAPRNQITSSATLCNSTLAGDIRTQITALFPKTKSLRQAASSQFDNILRTCPSAESQTKAIDFVRFTTDKFRNRQLTSAANANTVSHLLNDVLTYVGLTSGIPATALGSQGVVAVIGPSSSAQVVKTGDGKAGASFPAGALSQSVVVTIAPSVNQTDPLPTGLTQFPPFYDFTTYPAVTFGQQVTIGICVTYGNVSQAVLDRLHLARPDGATGGTTIELLPRVAAPFLGCPGLPGLTAAGPSVPDEQTGLFGRLFAAATGLVRPAELHAGSLRVKQFEGIGGLGGTVKNFGDGSTGTVDAAGPDLIVSGLTLTPTTPTAGGLATLAVEVKNIGGAPAGPSVVAFQPPFDSIAVPALAAGESFLTLIPRVADQDGSFTVTVLADQSDQVAELTETNNEATLTYSVNPGDPVPPLNGSPATVVPVVDGVLSPGEWANADCLPFQANTNPGDPGVDQVYAFLCVMNDATNLYVAVAYRRLVLPGATDVDAQVVLEFDNDGDGLWENGDDGFLFGTDGNFFDNFRTNAPPCASGVAEASCGFHDADYPGDGGTSEGVAAFTRDYRNTVFELSHPLNSADDIHDFSLSSGAQAGMFLMLSYIISDGAGGFANATTLVPGPGFGVFIPVVVNP